MGELPQITVLTYDDAKVQLIALLQRDLARHKAKRFASIGEGFDELASAIPRNQPPRFNKLLVALSFWDAWINACHHDWPTARGVPAKEEWPILAQELIDRLIYDQEIVNGEIARFGLSPWREVRRLFADTFRNDPETLDKLPPHLK